MVWTTKKETVLTPEERLTQALVPETEQPYKVPENWCWVKIGSVLTLQAGKNISSNLISDERDLDHPFPCFGGNGIRGYVSAFNRNGQFPIIGRQGALCGNLNWAYGQFYATEHAVVVECPEFIDKKWAYYILDYMNLNQYATATAQPGLAVSNIIKLPLSLPPLAEQQRIVEHIESLFAKLDEAKEKAQAAVDGYEGIRQAFLYQAFYGNLSAKWRGKQGIQKEASWEIKTLQSVCAMKITDGTHKTPTYCDSDTGIPFISAKDVTSGKICWDNIKYIIPELHEELYERLAPQVDDVLLAKNGTTGVAAIVEEEKMFDLYVTLAVLRPNKEIIDPRYLLNVVNSPICKRQFDERLTGIGVPNLHLRDIKEVEIPLPSLAEQKEIVRIIDSMSEKWNEAQAAAEKVIDKVDTMKKSILARAFRGELGTNDPADESAEELLKRVL